MITILEDQVSLGSWVIGTLCKNLWNLSAALFLHFLSIVLAHDLMSAPLNLALSPWVAWAGVEAGVSKSGPTHLNRPHEVCTALCYPIWLLSCPGRDWSCLTDRFLPDIRKLSAHLFEECFVVVFGDDEDLEEQVWMKGMGWKGEAKEGTCPHHVLNSLAGASESPAKPLRSPVECDQNSTDKRW